MNVSDQRLSVARLATYCEIIITRGLLPMDKEIALRTLVNSTCNAFGMASVVETEGAEQHSLPGHQCGTGSARHNLMRDSAATAKG
jgi:hypothetical protein